MVTESGLKRNLSYLWPRWHIVLRYGMREVGHMQTGKRVYPRQREPGKWLSYLLLFLSAVVVISGVVSRGGDLTIEPAATATPIPTDAYFDETVEEREITLPSATWYALQLGAFESETAAQELGQQFVKRGAAGYVWHDGGTARWLPSIPRGRMHRLCASSSARRIPWIPTSTRSICLPCIF